MENVQWSHKVFHGCKTSKRLWIYMIKHAFFYTWHMLMTHRMNSRDSESSGSTEKMFIQSQKKPARKLLVSGCVSFSHFTLQTLTLGSELSSSDQSKYTPQRNKIWDEFEQKFTDTHTSDTLYTLTTPCFPDIQIWHNFSEFTPLFKQREKKPLSMCKLCSLYVQVYYIHRRGKKLIKVYTHLHS